MEKLFWSRCEWAAYWMHHPMAWIGCTVLFFWGVGVFLLISNRKGR